MVGDMDRGRTQVRLPGDSILAGWAGGPQMWLREALATASKLSGRRDGRMPHPVV